MVSPTLYYFIDSNIQRSSTCLEIGVDSVVVKYSQGGMFSLSLWILPLRLSSWNPVEDVPYPNILKDKERSEKWDATINDTGYPGDLGLPTMPARFLTEPAKHVRVPGDTHQPMLLHLPTYPLAGAVGPRGTHTWVLKMHILWVKFRWFIRKHSLLYTGTLNTNMIWINIRDNNKERVYIFIYKNIKFYWAFNY